MLSYSDYINIEPKTSKHLRIKIFVESIAGFPPLLEANISIRNVSQHAGTMLLSSAIKLYALMT